MKLFSDCSATCTKHPTLLRLADSAICLFVIFPSMISFWRGIWDLCEVYFPPNHGVYSYCMSLAIGSCSIFDYALLPVLDRYLSRDRKVVYVIVTRVNMYLQSVLVLFYWRGVWDMANHFLLPYGWITGLIGVCVCYGSQLLTMTSRSVLFTPFAVALDTDKDILNASPCLQTEVIPICLGFTGDSWHIDLTYMHVRFKINYAIVLNSAIFISFTTTPVRAVVDSCNHL